MAFYMEKNMTYYKWNKKEIEFLKNNYSKFGGQYCAEKLNLPIKKVRKKAERLKLKVNSKTKSKIKKEQAIKQWKSQNHNYKVDPKQFEKIKKPEIAYLLGFIWADGYLNNKSQHFKISIEIAEKDYNDIKSIFKKTGEWNIQKRERPNRQAQIAMSTSQKPIYNILKNYEYENKSKKSPNMILDVLPENLKHFWWRGYFDGDGCFYYNEKQSLRQMSICSSFNQDWKHAIDLFEKLNITYKVIKRQQKTSKHSVVRVCGKENINKFGNYIYQSKIEIGLKRKYNKYLQIIQ